jgi:hypothetical protein
MRLYNNISPSRKYAWVNHKYHTYSELICFEIHSNADPVTQDYEKRNGRRSGKEQVMIVLKIV